MKVIQNIIPFTMLIFFNGCIRIMPLLLAANIVSIAQMLVIKKYFINERSLKAEIEAYSQNLKEIFIPTKARKCRRNKLERLKKLSLKKK